MKCDDEKVPTFSHSMCEDLHIGKIPKTTLKGGSTLKKAVHFVDAALAASLAMLSLSYSFIVSHRWVLYIAIPAYIFINVFSGLTKIDAETPRLLLLYHGAIMVCITLIAGAVSVAVHTIWYFSLGEFTTLFMHSVLYASLVLFLPFLNGLTFMYLTSVQLRLQWRLLGVIFALLVPINIFILIKMLEKCFDEVKFESDRIRMNRARAAQKICATKYPILLLHGIFFRDMNLFRHWGRMPHEIEINGGRIFYGNNNSAVPVAKSAEEIARRVRDIVAMTGSPKVNVLAYSKGGLDIRYAIEHFGIAPMIASVVTVASPHKGCKFLAVLLDWVPKWLQRLVAKIYNGVYRLLGDTEADVLGALQDLTPDICEIRDSYPVPDGVYARSLGSVMKRMWHGRFPMNITHLLAKRADGRCGQFCDGIASIDSYEFGERYTVIIPAGNRGVSHADLIDLHRENIKGFDIREFYVEIVADMKNKGL